AAAAPPAAADPAGAPADSMCSDTLSAGRDSLKGSDSLAAQADTAAPAWDLKEDQPDQSAIRYQAGLIDYLVDQNQIRLEGGARVNYKDITVTADSIDFFTRDQLMVVRSGPVLYDKDDAIHGDRMVYDFKARRGWIYNGATRFANGRYWGSRIRQVGERTLNVDYGRYTTCECDSPHFYFWSRRMKIYLDDKIVAEPVALCFSGVPILVIPYYFFPLRRDRHSGILIPRFGSNNYHGMFVKNLAYYQVLGGQADVTFAANLYEKVGWQGNFEGRWWYSPYFTFNTHYSYLEEKEPFKQRWSFSFDHNQSLGKRTRLSGNGNFVSDKTYYYDYSENRNTRMEQELRSYLALDHSWTIASVNVVADYNQNLIAKTKSARLPEASFRLYQKNILGRFLQASGASYFASFLSRDTIKTDKRQVWDNQANLSSGFKLLEYISVSPGARLVATWYDRDTAGRRNPVRYFYSGGISAGTTLYGLLRLNLGPLRAFRHQMQPQVSYSYAPKIDQGRFYQVGSAGAYGQQKSVGASLGNTFSVKFKWGGKTRKADLLAYGASSGLNLLQKPRRWSPLSSNFNILPGNRLFDCQLSSSYDWYKRMTQSTSLSFGFHLNGTWLDEPQKDSLKLGAKDAAEAGLTFGARDNITADTAFAAADSTPPFPSPPSSSATGGLRRTTAKTGQAGRGEGGVGSDSTATRPDSLSPAADSLNPSAPLGAGPSGDSASIGIGKKQEKKKGGLPWSFSLSFSQSWYTGQHITQSGIRGNADLQLTKNWKFTYGQYYDFKRNEIVSRDYSIYRDLHCWEMSFSWIP
ncbi:MAG: LPS assembly protein LptD, partial [Candidatus Edwardsbacteria bacterium]|nr:LPS assembly protein LptD [Candidatus Edwardsbacteria bacterium]